MKIMILWVNGIKSIYGELSQNNINDSDNQILYLVQLIEIRLWGMITMTPFTVDLEMTS